MIEVSNKNQQKNVARYCKESTFGLRKTISLESLVWKQMVLRALEYDDSFSVYSTSERSNVEHELVIPIYKQNNCTSC